MLSFLPAPLLGALSVSLFVLNTVLWALPFFALGVLYWACPGARPRRRLSPAFLWMADTWNACNSAIFRLTQPTRVEARLPEKLSRRESYLLVCNHRSWVDVVMLWHLLGGRVPFLRFFLKSELIWLPILGPAGAMLGFPFMKRYSKELVARKPHLKGADLATTRRACERFRYEPVALVNFVEGTRFSRAKHGHQQSPYRHLLKPRAGGLAFAMAALDGIGYRLLDCTIHYPQGTVSFLDLFCGRIRSVRVEIEEMAVPRELARGDYLGDESYRAAFQRWLGGVWERKDERLDGWFRHPFPTPRPGSALSPTGSSRQELAIAELSSALRQTQPRIDTVQHNP